jgi:hypothetical protein
MKKRPDAGAQRLPRWLLSSLLVLLCLVILNWALLRSSAAWNFFAAQSITEQMHEAGAITPAAIANAQDRLDRALSRFPGHPDYLDLQGHLLELKANRPGVVGAEREALLEAAAARYRASLSARPLWPYGWARLLGVKDRLGQVDSEFKTAMHRAAETGPWEPRVQLQIIQSGLRHWDQLSRTERELLKSRSADAMKMRPREVFELARRYGRPDIVCPMAADQPQISRWCSKVL